MSSSHTTKKKARSAFGGEVAQDTSEEVERLLSEQMAALEAENAALRQEIASLTQADTERMWAEESSQRSEERLRSVLDSARDVIVRFNLQTGTYEYVSPLSGRLSRVYAG